MAGEKSNVGNIVAGVAPPDPQAFQPNFNSSNPYANMPVEYAQQVAAVYKPTATNPLSPVQVAALNNQLPAAVIAHPAVSTLTPAQQQLTGATTLFQVPTTTVVSSGQPTVVAPVTPVPNFNSAQGTAAYQEYLKSPAASAAGITPSYVQALNANTPSNLVNLSSQQIVVQTLQNIVANPSSTPKDVASATASLTSMGATVPASPQTGVSTGTPIAPTVPYSPNMSGYGDAQIQANRDTIQAFLPIPVLGNPATDVPKLKDAGATPAQLSLYMDFFGKSWNYNIGTYDNSGKELSDTGGGNQQEKTANEILASAGLNGNMKPSDFINLGNINVPKSIYDKVSDQEKINLNILGGRIPQDATSIKFDENGIITSYSTKGQGDYALFSGTLDAATLAYIKQNNPTLYAQLITTDFVTGKPNINLPKDTGTINDQLVLAVNAYQQTQAQTQTQGVITQEAYDNWAKSLPNVYLRDAYKNAGGGEAGFNAARTAQQNALQEIQNLPKSAGVYWIDDKGHEQYNIQNALKYVSAETIYTAGFSGGAFGVVSSPFIPSMVDNFKLTSVMPSAIITAQSIYATGLVNANPTQATVQTIKDLGYPQSIIDTAQKQVEAANNALKNEIPNVLNGKQTESGQVQGILDAIQNAGYSKGHGLGGTSQDAANIQWKDLTDDQKLQVANLYAQDLYKSNPFAELTKQESEVAAKEGTLGQYAYQPILGITLPIAKSTTGQPVSASEIEGAVVTGLMDILIVGGSSVPVIEGGKLGNVGSIFEDLLGEKGASILIGGLSAGAAGANIPNTISTISSSETSIGQKILAGGMEGLMVVGGVQGLGAIGKVEVVPSGEGVAKITPIVAEKTVVSPLDEAIGAEQSKIGLQGDLAKSVVSVKTTLSNLGDIPTETAQSLANAYNGLSGVADKLVDTYSAIQTYLKYNLPAEVSLGLINASKLIEDSVANIKSSWDYINSPVTAQLALQNATDLANKAVINAVGAIVKAAQATKMVAVQSWDTVSNYMNEEVASRDIPQNVKDAIQPISDYLNQEVPSRDIPANVQKAILVVSNYFNEEVPSRDIPANIRTAVQPVVDYLGKGFENYPEMKSGELPSRLEARLNAIPDSVSKVSDAISKIPDDVKQVLVTNKEAVANYLGKGFEDYPEMNPSELPARLEARLNAIPYDITIEGLSDSVKQALRDNASAIADYLTSGFEKYPEMESGELSAKLEARLGAIPDRVEYFKLSAETIVNEVKLEIQAEEIAKPLRDAISKVKSMYELDKLTNSEAYKTEITKYQDLLEQRINYYEQQMAKLTPLADKLSALELGAEDVVRKVLLSNYIENLENAKAIQYMLNYGKVSTNLDTILDKILSDKQDELDAIQENAKKLSDFKLQQQLENLKTQVAKGELGGQDLVEQYQTMSEQLAEMQAISDAKLKFRLDDLKIRVAKGELGGADLIDEISKIKDPLAESKALADARLKINLLSLKEQVAKGELGGEDFIEQYEKITDQVARDQALADAKLKMSLDSLKEQVTKGEIGGEDFIEQYQSMMDDTAREQALADAKLRMKLDDLKMRVAKGELGGADLIDEISKIVDQTAKEQEIANAKLQINLQNLQKQVLKGEIGGVTDDELMSKVDNVLNNKDATKEQMSTSAKPDIEDIIKEAQKSYDDDTMSEALKQRLVDMRKMLTDIADQQSKNETLGDVTGFLKRMKENPEAIFKNTIKDMEDYLNKVDSLKQMESKANQDLFNQLKEYLKDPSKFKAVGDNESEIQNIVSKLQAGIDKGVTLSPEETALWNSISSDTNRLTELMSANNPDYASEISQLQTRIQDNIDQLAMLEKTRALGIETDFEKSVEERLVKLGYSDKDIADLTDNEKIDIISNNKIKGSDIISFTTEKGSTYEVKGDTTIRNKAYGIHEGDYGLKPQSLRTIYLTEEQAKQIFSTWSEGKISGFEYSESGDLIVKVNDGSFINLGRVAQKPEIGLSPFENLPDGQMHLGDKIVDISKPLEEGGTPSKGTQPESEQPSEGGGGTKVATKIAVKTETKVTSPDELQKLTDEEKAKIEAKPHVITPDELQELMDKEVKKETLPEEKTTAKPTPFRISTTTTTKETTIPQVEGDSYYALIWENGQIVVKLITPTPLIQGYIANVVKNDVVFSPKEETQEDAALRQRLTPEQYQKLINEAKNSFGLLVDAITSKQALVSDEEAVKIQESIKPAEFQQPLFKTEPITKTETKTQTQTETQTPQPTPQPVPIPIPVPIPEPQPTPQPTPQPQPVPPPAVKEGTKPPPPIVYSSLPPQAFDEKGKLKRAVIIWRQGAPTGFPQGLWKVAPPPYKEMFTLRSMPQGATKYATGKGSAFKTLSIIGGSPEKDVDLNLGWANIHITAKSGQLDIDYRPNEKANTGKREDTIGMGEGQIPYQGAEEDRLKARLTKEEKQMLAENPDLTVEDFYEPPQFEYNQDEIGERPEDIPDHVTQRMPRQKEEIPRELQKVELPQYRYGKIKVYLVNGDYIRTRYADESIGDRDGVDFTQGGHSGVYWEIIPPNEIWVDRSLAGLDRKATILHEMTERREMEDGKEYSDAHNDYANPPEIAARKNPQLIDRMIRDEMDRYEKPQPKLRRRNETKRPPTVAEIEKEYEKYNVPKASREIEVDEDEIAPKYYLGRRISPKVEANII